MSKPQRQPPFKLAVHRSTQQVRLLVDRQWYDRYGRLGKKGIKDCHPTRGIIVGQGLTGPILKSGMELERDCQAVDMRQWEEIYDTCPDSQPIARYLKHSDSPINTNLMVLQVVVLDNNLLLHLEKSQPNKGIQIAEMIEIDPSDTVCTVEEDIRAAILQSAGYEGKDIRVRLWLPTPQILPNRSDFLQWLPNFFPFMLKHFQIEMVGSLLDGTKTIEEEGVTQASYLVVQLMVDGIQCCYNKENILTTGCPTCRKILKLQVVCKCNPVRFCSNECLKHDRSCSQAKKNTNPMPFNTEKANQKDNIQKPVQQAKTSISGPRVTTRPVHVTPFSPPRHRSEELVPCRPGLQNLGMTCYMNAALQCLMRVDEFVNQIKSSTADQNLGRDPLASSLRELIKQLQQKSAPRKGVAPATFKKQVGLANRTFNNYNQHDSQEFLSFLLDYLITKEQSSSRHSTIKDLFEGTFSSTVKCLVCSRTSTQEDPFMSINLSVQQWHSCTVTGLDGLRQYVAKCQILGKHLAHQLENIALKMGIDFPHGLLVWTDTQTIEPSKRKSLRGLTRGIYLRAKSEMEKDSDKSVLIKLTFGKKSKVLLEPMLFGYNSQRDTLQKLRIKVCQWFAKYIDEQLAKEDMFGVTVYFEGQSICGVCNKRCSGCSLPNDNTLVAEFLQILIQQMNEHLIEEDKQIGEKAPLLEFHFQEKVELKKKSTELNVDANQRSVTLQECFREFFEPEILEQGNWATCHNCSKPTETVRSLAVRHPPKYLTVHFKRFQKDLEVKIATSVSFPVDAVDMAEILHYQPSKTADLEGISTTYELVAICNHIGISINMGHYTASCLTEQGWFLFDDSAALPIATTDLQPSNQAYYLIYRRK